MQTGLQAAITAFEGLHNKFLRGIHKEKYLNYCENKDIKLLIKSAKHSLASEIPRTWLYRRDGTRMDLTSQEKETYIGIWEIEGWLNMLELPPPKELAREIISKKPVGEETINELLKLYYECKLISFHHVYLRS